MSHSTEPREPQTTPTIESSSEVLDGEVFHELLGSLHQPAALAAVYRKFIGNATAFICELRDQDDAARIDTLHTLKGSAAMMGAKRMAERAARLQAQAQCSSVQVARAIQELEDELLEFRVAAAERLLALGVSLGNPD